MSLVTHLGENSGSVVVKFGVCEDVERIYFKRVCVQRMRVLVASASERLVSLLLLLLQKFGSLPEKKEEN